MATSARGGMKDFYKQKKKGGISKQKPSSWKTKSPATASDGVHPAALVSSLDDYGESENMLREFDMDSRYGPCLGMTRMERWERARKFGLNPPKDIEILLKAGKVRLECLWDGRV